MYVYVSYDVEHLSNGVDGGLIMATKNNSKSTPEQFKISFKNSIKTKLTGLMILVVAVPLLISIIVSYVTSTNKSKSDALDLLTSNVNYVETQFSLIIQKNLIALETFANSPSTITYLNNVDSEDSPIPESAMLAQMDMINTNIDDGNLSVILSKPDGEQLIRTDRNALANIADREYFQEAISGQLGISDVIVSKSAGNRIFILCIPIYDDQTGEIIGTIQRSIDLNNLHDFLAASIDDGYITDTQGIVAAHATHEIAVEDEPEDHSDAEFIGTTETAGMYESTFTGTLAYVVWEKEPTTGYTVVVAKKNNDIMAQAYKSAITVIIIGFILMVIALAISVIMARSFTEPIKGLAMSFAALADGRFVKVNKYDKRNDEFGMISKAANSVIDTLNEIVTSIKASANDIGTSSEQLSTMANQISTTTEDVTNAVQEIATGATQQADEIQQATENVGLIGDAVEDVQNSSNSLSDTSIKMKEASEASSKSLSSLQQSSIEMTEKIDEISHTIQQTQNAVNNINEKVEGITSIATQTNLLSLNASIEAARAGEAGKGFAVVAEEIGKLAEDSKHMADDIKNEMEELLVQSNAAVQAAEDVKQGNSDQQLALGETLEAVNGMLEDINANVNGVKLISSGAETCETAKNSMVDTMSALSAISEENAASSEETGASMEELSATVTTLAKSANDLKDIAEKLNEKITFFKV